MRRSQGLAAIVIATACATARSEQAAHEIPFAFSTQQPIVMTAVNGGPRLPFVVDTGASINVIDEAVARQAGLVGGSARAMTGGGQGTVQARFADGLAFDAGGVRWERQRAALVPIGYPDRKHFAGLLGAPILMQYVVQFDFPARVMRLFDPGTYRPAPGATVVPFELLHDLPVVRAQLDVGGKTLEARLMLDTGAGDAYVDLNRPYVDAHRLLDRIGNTRAASRPAAIGGTAPFVYASGARLRLGDLAFEVRTLGLSRAMSGSSSRTERDGIVGNALYQDLVVTFDYGRRVVVFRK